LQRQKEKARHRATETGDMSQQLGFNALGIKYN